MCQVRSSSGLWPSSPPPCRSSSPATCSLLKAVPWGSMWSVFLSTTSSRMGSERGPDTSNESRLDVWRCSSLRKCRLANCAALFPPLSTAAHVFLATRFLCPVGARTWCPAGWPLSVVWWTLRTCLWTLDERFCRRAVPGAVLIRLRLYLDVPSTQTDFS